MPNLIATCPLCGAAEPFRIYNPKPVACHHYETMPEGSRLDQCGTCQFIFLNPQPTLEESLSYEAADEEWYPTEDVSEGNSVGHVYSATWALQFIRRFQPLTGKFLDVGSNRGFLLDAASKAGFDAYGIEPTTRTAEFSRRYFNANVFIGLIEDNPYQPASFDVITMWHVLEHIPDIRTFLEHAIKLLKPTGALCIQVPYLDYWPRPVHLNYFGCDLLLRVLGEMGLSPILVDLRFDNFLTIAVRHEAAGAIPSDADLRLWESLVEQSRVQNELKHDVNLHYAELRKAIDYLSSQAARSPTHRVKRIVKRIFSRGS